MTTYTMEAKENYSSALVAQFNAVTQPKYCYADNERLCANYDFGLRDILYPVNIAVGDTKTNNTGFTLWSGTTAYAPGATIDTITQWNLQIGQKNIDSDAVTFFDTFDVSQTVPAGIGAHANGSITFDTAGGVANGNNIVLNGVTWTFVTGTPSGNQTKIQATVGDTIRQLSWDLNNSANASINVAWYEASAVHLVGNQTVLSVEYLTSGAGGNAYTLNVGTAAIAVNGATLTGGTNTSSDGTWRRVVIDQNVFAGGSIPVLVDPFTHDIFIHAFSCEVYFFQRSNNFAQAISPRFPLYGSSQAVYLMGLTSDWVMAFEKNPTGNRWFMYIFPRVVTTKETALDKILSYGQWEFPATITGQFTMLHRWAFDRSGNVYVLGLTSPGTKNYKLYKFTPPANPPVSGGGFTDVTPWAAGTGPNTNCAAYTSLLNVGNSLSKEPNQSFLFYLPATQDLVAITGNYSSQNAGSSDFALTFFDCTYINVSGAPTFDYHSNFVNGYMSSSWVSTNLAGAAYAVVSFRETNLYLDQVDFTYGGYDYTKRWFMFMCYPVVGGVVQKDGPEANLFMVLVQYQFVSGAAPVVLQVIDERPTWATAYTTYGAAIAAGYGGVWPALVPVVVNSAATGANGFFFQTDTYFDDIPLYDPTTNSFWLSGAAQFVYDLNSATFAARATLNGGDYFSGNGTAPLPPFVKLSFSSSPPPPPPANFLTADIHLWG